MNTVVWKIGVATTLAAWLLSTGPVAAADLKADLYVSPQGNDAWSGTAVEPNPAKTDGPLATIQRAGQLVRTLKAQAGRARPVVVAIRGGTYFLAQPICLGPEDSGTAQVPVIYQAYGHDQPDAQRRRENRRLAAERRRPLAREPRRRQERQVVVHATLRGRSAAVPAASAPSRLLQDRPGTPAGGESRP